MENEMQNKIINPAFLQLTEGLDQMNRDFKLKYEKFRKETKSELDLEIELIKTYLPLLNGLEQMSRDLKLKSEKFSKETKSELDSELEFIKVILTHIFMNNLKKEDELKLKLIKPVLLILEREMISTRDMLLKICDDENVKKLKLKADCIIKMIKIIMYAF